MFAKLKPLVAAAVLLSASATAVSDDYGFNITNDTDHTITAMYVSPAASEYWEENLFENGGALRPGKTKRVRLSGYENPIFDVRLVDEEDDRYTFWKVDVSAQDIVVTPDDMDDD